MSRNMRGLSLGELGELFGIREEVDCMAVLSSTPTTTAEVVECPFCAVKPGRFECELCGFPSSYWNGADEKWETHDAPTGLVTPNQLAEYRKRRMEWRSYVKRGF